MELSKALNISYYPIVCEGTRCKRYPVQAVKTIKLIKKKRPCLVYCQNPSIVLATLLAVLKSKYRFALIVDRHTNFKFGTERSVNPKWVVFHKLSRLTLRHADLTIVTNEPLAKLIESQGANAFVLQDKLPQITFQTSPLPLTGSFNFLFICTFSHDEPVKEVLDAFQELQKDYRLYITGNFRKFREWRRYIHNPNIKFLGFVSERDYMHYLQSCDATIVLTVQDYTLNCGSYESIVAGKPQLVAGTNTIRDYFSKGCVYIDHFDKDSIKRGLMELVKSKSELKQAADDLKGEIEARWRIRFEKLQKLEEALVGSCKC